LQAQHRAAADRFRQALAIDPKHTDAAFYLAWSLHAQGETEAARKQFSEAMAIDPRWPMATARSFTFLATHPDAGSRNGPLALLQAQVANQALGTPDAELLDIFAVAYAEMGQFPDAVTAARKAVELSDKSSDLKAEREKRLKLYENREPFRQSEPLR
jgi:tetratricopeptide (TPR) repeat protein